MNIKDILIGMGCGLISGTVTAIGGSFKDAPYQGFNPVAFLRSPIAASVLGGIFRGIVPDAGIIETVLAAGGLERIIVDGVFKVLRDRVSAKFVIGEYGLNRIKNNKSVDMLK